MLLRATSSPSIAIRKGLAVNASCPNISTAIEYRTEFSGPWTSLVRVGDLACRTSLIGGGYFNIHTIKLPRGNAFEVRSS